MHSQPSKSFSQIHSSHWKKVRLGHIKTPSSIRILYSSNLNTVCWHESWDAYPCFDHIQDVRFTWNPSGYSYPCIWYYFCLVHTSVYIYLLLPIHWIICGSPLRYQYWLNYCRLTANTPQIATYNTKAFIFTAYSASSWTTCCYFPDLQMLCVSVTLM